MINFAIISKSILLRELLAKNMTDPELDFHSWIMKYIVSCNVLLLKWRPQKLDGGHTVSILPAWDVRFVSRIQHIETCATRRSTQTQMFCFVFCKKFLHWNNIRCCFGFAMEKNQHILRITNKIWWHIPLPFWCHKQWTRLMSAHLLGDQKRIQLFFKHTDLQAC